MLKIVSSVSVDKSLIKSCFQLLSKVIKLDLNNMGMTNRCVNFRENFFQNM